MHFLATTPFGTTAAPREMSGPRAQLHTSAV
jgi:hypothetical protein